MWLFAVCVHEINEWMRASRLRLNPTKTQVMWLGSGQQLKHVDISDISLLSTTVQVVESARDLGVIIDSQLTLSSHVAALCRAGYYQLRQLRPVVQSMTAEAARTAAAAFISSRLDYCNSLLYGLPNTLLCKLQSVQNATARLITGTRRRYHITPVLHELHWLAIRERVKFKVACLVRQSLTGQASLYLADDCCLVSDSARRSLRSADVPTWVVLRTLTSYGDRTFAAAWPRVWNSLPVQLCNPDITYGLFRRQLKGHLFREAWTRRSVTSDMRHHRKTLTYLLTFSLNWA